MDPFLAEIVMFGGNFAPRGWAFCNGQLLSINANQALFSLLGTTYGGDGRTTFGLPDMRGRTPVHPGTGPGLTTYKLGQRGGVETVTLTQNQMPAHSHTASLGAGATATVSIPASSANGTTAVPTNGIIAQGLDVNDENVSSFGAVAAADTNLAPFPAPVSGTATIFNNGGSQWHTNIQPYLAVNYIIALQGTFPSRN